MELAPGTIVDHRYTVERLLGIGGQGKVYLVRHNHLGSLHAMKVVADPSVAMTQRLLREGRLQASIRHPNIVSTTDIVFVGENQPAIVMEYVEGVDLGLYAESRTLPLPQVDGLVQGILAGVGAVHAAGLIHRDLKPDNIMLQRTPEGELVPRVMDFGLAVEPTANRRQTRSGARLGTPNYMSPEQVRDSKTVDHRSDIWSLGAILYELCSGQRAFDGSDVLEIFKAVDEVRCVPIRKIAPDLPDRMATAIEGSLRRNPEERFPDVESLLHVWVHGAEGLPVISLASEDLEPEPSDEEATHVLDQQEVLAELEASDPSAPAAFGFPASPAPLPDSQATALRPLRGRALPPDSGPPVGSLAPASSVGRPHTMAGGTMMLAAGTSFAVMGLGAGVLAVLVAVVAMAAYWPGDVPDTTPPAATSTRPKRPPPPNVVSTATPTAPKPRPRPVPAHKSASSGAASPTSTAGLGSQETTSSAPRPGDPNAADPNSDGPVETDADDPEAGDPEAGAPDAGEPKDSAEPLAPVAPAPMAGQVEVFGARIELRSARGVRYEAGEVPVGDYEVWVQLGDEPYILYSALSPFTVRADQTYTIACNAGTGVCRPTGGSP